ncbi:ATP-grasp domain-containing protein [Streptomyces sp. NPDC050732]|uniref:ATP-grasp domain-containing protein n=1 Tax=Streptomyces sp. NPDC050732 TaxID=3154632 RepID=UPI0034149015
MAAPAPAFVQVGATRDGLDPYRVGAATRGLTTVLVETPGYLAWRRQLGRAPFDKEIPVEHPHDPRRLLAALHTAGVRPAVLLAGFERYAAAAFDAAATLAVPPASGNQPPFHAPDKAGQRTALARSAPQVRQPRHALTRQDHSQVAIPYPRVVKPVDGGGGLGVYLVRNAEDERRARRVLARTENYGGGAFTGTLTEEYVAGTEFSVQGVARHGRAHVLSVCEKLVLLEPAPEDGLCGFREAGHLVLPPATADPRLAALAQTCLTTFGYHDGPFHLDAIAARDGGLHFVEMGFRLSGGGLVALTERALGVRWADLALDVHLGAVSIPDLQAPPDNQGPFLGQLACTRPAQLDHAARLARTGASVDILPAAPVPDEASLDPAHAAVLASDRQRHAVVLGRVIVQARTREDARRLLTDCATAQGEDPCAASSSRKATSTQPPSWTPRSA